MDECSPKRTSTPEDEGSTDRFIRTEAPDGQDPRDLKDNGTNARQRVDVAKLAALEPNVLVEAEDSSISKLVNFQSHWCSTRNKGSTHVVAVEG